MKSKMCADCGHVGPISDFPTNGKNKKNGRIKYKPYCRPCWANRQRNWRADNPEMKREQNRKYLGEHLSHNERERRKKLRRVRRAMIHKEKRFVYQKYKDRFNAESEDNRSMPYKKKYDEVYKKFRDRARREFEYNDAASCPGVQK